MMAQFKFPSPFSRAYLRSPQLLQDALARLQIGPFQTDGELLCLMFLTPAEEEPDETGVTHRPWATFSRVLNDLYDHPDQFKSVTPSDSWLEWLQELDDQAPFNPADKLDLMRSLWKLMEKATDGKPSHTFSLQECGWELCDRKTWAERYRPPPITQLQVLKWRHWKPAQLKDLEPTTQRALEEKLRSHWANRLISHLIPFAAEIPAMAAVMGDGDDHQEFLHLLGDARFSTLRQRCLFFERLKKQDLLQVPWTESAVRQMLSKLQAAECTPNYIQQAWDTLKWFSSKFQTLDVESLQRLQSKKKSLQETLVSTTSTPQRKAVVPSREVIWALEQGAAAVGAVSHSKGVQAREAIDAFIMGLVRFQVGCCARFNDMQHTSPGTLKVTTSTIEMMAWQTKTASAFKIKKNPVPLIAPKLSLSGVDWWTDWVETLKTLFALERFQDMDYLIPTLSKDFQGVIPRPGSSDRSLRWLKEALIRHGVPQELVQPLSWHSFRVFIPDCAYQLGIPRTQRQYLGNWQTESTADIYTREKRNVVVDIWGKVLSRLRDINLDPGKEVREDLSHEDWDDKHGPSDHGSPVKSGSFHLVSEDENTEQQSDGLGSGKSKPSTRTARSVEPPHEDLPRRNMFQVVPSDEVLPPVGPLIVVASLRKTGNPPKRKLHLLDREGRAVGCGWSPDLSKISSMGKEDYENEVGELVQCSRCFMRFTLPNEWLFDVSQDPAVALDSDSSVSFGSLTDSSVDTASECDKVTLPSLERDGALLPLQ